ncbi:hypothetical protein BJF92_09250 [Rhizobium rhizosphaerae]|uniref:Methyltransferase type 12 n=1 Tax=Xaviernesmea rhizosphaerae TaxID=1672749 RepID=A0A1Q9AKJ9_9HYPH|nr:hypothetical protein [Xaviernesmea rhizosphaerae]OLP55805.1 hypothetical protein BJF92_09250 [Xaviernesmea rhizosphaerae]
MSSERQLASDLGGIKHDFAPTYDQAWPHDYLQAHLGLDYVIPQNAKPTFERLIAACMKAKRKDSLKIVDVGCSYGINAALLKCAMTLDELYAAASRSGTLRRRNIASHRSFFAERLRRHDLIIVGIDPAVRAAGYARETGLVDAVITADLEQCALNEREVDLLADVDLIISTGCVGYVTERSFDRLYGAVAQFRPWVACFVMHPFSYDNIGNTLSRYRLATREIKSWCQRQRRFSTLKEKRAILATMKSSGVDDRLERTTGYVYASFHLSMPEEMMPKELDVWGIQFA